MDGCLQRQSQMWQDQISSDAESLRHVLPRRSTRESARADHDAILLHALPRCSAVALPIRRLFAVFVWRLPKFVPGAVQSLLLRRVELWLLPTRTLSRWLVPEILTDDPPSE